MVYDDKMVTTGTAGNVTPFHYKDHIKHKKCLYPSELAKIEKKKKKKYDDTTTNLVSS